MHLFLPALWVGVGHMAEPEVFHCLAYAMSLQKIHSWLWRRLGIFHVSWRSCLEEQGDFFWELPPPVTCSAGVTADPNASQGVGPAVLPHGY